MNESPTTSSGVNSRSLTAADRLQHLTDEPWAIDWINSALVCKHGVAVNNLDAMAMGVKVLRELLQRYHFAMRRA